MIELLLVFSIVCRQAVLLPAYAHNDYRNAHPLVDALALGYRGVEVDLFRVGAELLLGHDRSELRPGRNLTRVYLEPLVERVRSCGFVLPDSTSFLLNIELKEADSAAFRLLVSQLLAHEELFGSPGPRSQPYVQVALVGWWPTTDSNSISWPAFLKVHLPLGRTRDDRDQSVRTRVGLVSIDYGQVITWSGSGAVPPAGRAALATARELAAASGVPIRVHHAPAQQSVYAWLLAEGVTLIGVEHLARSRSLLQKASGPPGRTTVRR